MKFKIEIELAVWPPLLLKPKNEQSMYRLRNSEFVVPLVKAVQEQQNIIEKLTKLIEDLESRK
ncbi:MAG: hypothetical protein IPK06_11805 [Ignavibacteriae bacterium]|nr:hypothetical protein [Ignavibacteriota bacterium]